jgi:hypothetical protein
VKSVATRRFWQLFQALPLEAKDLAIKTYRLWRKNPSHPSLHYRHLKGSPDRFTVRIGKHYRAIGLHSKDTVTWVWIGTHAEYDRLAGS